MILQKSVKTKRMQLKNEIKKEQNINLENNKNSNTYSNINNPKFFI